MEKKMMSQKGLPYKSNIALALIIAFLALSAIFVSTPVESKSKAKSERAKALKAAKAEKAAESQDTVAEAEVVKDAPPKSRVISLTFKQMGAWSAIKLRGVDGSQTLSFPVRADEVVVAAKLKIAYDYSPALIAELSHLKISINEHLAALEALPKDKGLANRRDIDLDPRLFGEMNYLRFKLIGHYTLQCEDPYHSSLWLNVSDLGRLELTLAPVSMVNDLKLLPAPFLDKRENTQLKLPFVFANTPSFSTLKAAGVVASWFGLQAGSRGAQFPVSLNALPDGNAVVFLQGNDKIDGVKNPEGSTLSIQPHPTNPQAKLLVVTGSNEDEMARSARAISLFATTLSGQQVTITKETETAARKPYDAPAWIPTDRPVKFGELIRLEELKVHGYFPEIIRLNYRISPDLFTWRTPGAPLTLKYRATRLPQHINSSLNISQNANFIQALALNESYKKINEADRLQVTKAEALEPRTQSLFVPPYVIGGRDQLQFSHYFDIIKEGVCKHMPPDNLQASIDAESTLDFSGFPHYVALPNLAYFSNIGFPFTRMADLSETAVVLPGSPNADELGVYLTLMGRMGEATGYPAVRHALVSDVDVANVSERDLMVIASGKNPSLMTKWADRLPMVQTTSERRVRELYKTWWPTYRWEQKDVQATPQSKGSMSLIGAGSLTTVMAFESPLQSARSVVFFFADKASDLRKISDVLTDPERMSSIQGDFVVVDDKSVTHTKVSETYYMGSLPWLSKLRWFFSDQPLLLGLIGILISILIAAILYRPLRRIAVKHFKRIS